MLFRSPDSEHTLTISYVDTNGKNRGVSQDFKVKPYTVVDPGLRVSDSLKGDSGFIVYPTQISLGQGDQASIHGSAVSGATKQAGGGFIDPDTEEQYLNEADLDSFEGWSYYPEIVGWVNQSQDAPDEAGYFKESNGYEDEPLTGIDRKSVV